MRRNPVEFAAVLAEIGDEFGIRASIEVAVFRRAWLGPRLVWSQP